MIGTAKYKPSFYDCKSCCDSQVALGFDYDCDKCRLKRKCTILEIKNTFWQSNALVLYEDGTLEKVSLDRLHDIKLKGVNEDVK